MLDKFHQLIIAINGPLWDFLVVILLGAGFFYTFRTFFAQFRLLPHSFKTMFHGIRAKDSSSGITPFQAFATGLASRVGIGNIAGVAIAISVGGPGAVFWMWITALLGMSLAFAESTLAQLFKIRDDKTGQFRGGPAYYILTGLKQKWLAILFSLSLILAFGFVFNAVQSNSIVAATANVWNWDPSIVGICLVLLTAAIIFGGIRRVSKIAERVVPFMAVLYLFMAIYAMVVNYSELGHIFQLIITNAFQFDAAAGGFFGGLISQTMVLGIKRGLFSNEAGMGSAPNAAAAADVKHPADQGIIQMLGVFLDTFVVCSCTAFIILLSDVAGASHLSGVELTQNAIVGHVGNWGADFLAVVIFLFAYTSIIGNYAYAESNVLFIKNSPKTLLIFRLLVLVMVYFGAVNSVPLVWDMADTSMAFMALINLLAIVLLAPYTIILLKDYKKQLKQGKKPVFDIKNYPKLEGKIKTDIWN